MLDRCRESVRFFWSLFVGVRISFVRSRLVLAVFEFFFSRVSRAFVRFCAILF